MKMQLSHFSQWLLSAVISLLGFSSCSELGEQPDMYGTPLMYGTPTADYKAEGFITDENGNPIEGIKIEADTKSYSDGTSETKIVYSDSDGQFITPKYFQHQILSLTATDIDGKKNGGEFETKTIDLKEMKPVLDNSTAHDWYVGIYCYQVDFKLTRKSADNE